MGPGVLHAHSGAPRRPACPFAAIAANVRRFAHNEAVRNSWASVELDHNRKLVTTSDRKALTRQYKESPRPAGAFIVRNLASGQVLLGVTPDLPGMINRQRFQLEMGSHPDKALQADWNSIGPDNFAIEVLDEIKAPEDADWDVASDLAALKLMWLERLRGDGVALYPMSSRGA